MALGDVALDGVGQSVHAGGGSQTLGHGGHHIGVNHSDLGDVVGIDADELALLLDIGDDVIDGDFGRSTGGGGHGDGEDGVLLGGRDTFQRADIRELRVVDDDADSLCGVHGRAAADGHDAVCLSSLEGRHAVLHIGDGGVGLDLAVHSVGKVCRIQQVGDFLGHAELDEVGVGADERLLVAAGGQFGNDVLDGTVAMVGNGIQYDTISHNYDPPNHCTRFQPGLSVFYFTTLLKTMQCQILMIFMNFLYISHCFWTNVLFLCKKVPSQANSKGLPERAGLTTAG